jgi:hypothetical protein
MFLTPSLIFTDLSNITKHKKYVHKTYKISRVHILYK